MRGPQSSTSVEHAAPGVAAASVQTDTDDYRENRAEQTADDPCGFAAALARPGDSHFPRDTCVVRGTTGLLEAQIATSSAPLRVYGRHRRPERGAGPQRGARRYRGARHATAELCHTLFATPLRSAALPPRPAGARERGATPAKAAWRRRGAARHAPPRCPQGSAPPRRRASSHADAPPRFSASATHATSRPGRGAPRAALSSSDERGGGAPARNETSVQERNQSMIRHSPFCRGRVPHTLLHNAHQVVTLRAKRTAAGESTRV